MFLKNYTSNVPVTQTIHRIEQVLIKCGVTGIMKEYSDLTGTVAAVTFKIELGNAKPWVIRLPANVQKAWDALWKDYVDGDKVTPDGFKILYNNRKSKTKADFKDQAERTAWKIIQDWIEVQMSMVQMQQADFREVFLAYVWDGEQTYFQRLDRNGLNLITEKSGTT